MTMELIAFIQLACVSVLRVILEYDVKKFAQVGLMDPSAVKNAFVRMEVFVILSLVTVSVLRDLQGPLVKKHASLAFLEIIAVMFAIVTKRQLKPATMLQENVVVRKAGKVPCATIPVQNQHGVTTARMCAIARIMVLAITLPVTVFAREAGLVPIVRKHVLIDFTATDAKSFVLSV